MLWLTNEPDDYILDHTKNMITHSKMIEKSCAENGMKYVDTSDNFEESLNEAKRYLLLD